MEVSFAGLRANFDSRTESQRDKPNNGNAADARSSRD